MSSEPKGDTLLSIATWAGVLFVALTGFWVQLLLFLLTIFDRNRRLPGRMYRKMGWWSAKISPAWHFRVAGEVPAYRPRRTVVVSNHQSQGDPFLISGLPWEMKWLGKKELFKIPFVGWSMVLAGDIALNRGERDSAKSAMAKCADYLRRDMPVMIFPEGTRSRDGELLPFKAGAFRLAIEEQADILPLAVAGTRFALPKGSWKVGRSDGLVTVGEPISTEGMTLDDIDALMARTRAAIEALRATIIAQSSEGASAAG